MFAEIYNCPKCGQIWQVEEYEAIDTDHDDIEIYMMCRECGSFVEPVLTDEGKPLYHALTDEEAFWDNYSVEEEFYE